MWAKRQVMLNTETNNPTNSTFHIQVFPRRIISPQYKFGGFAVFLSRCNFSVTLAPLYLKRISGSAFLVLSLIPRRPQSVGDWGRGALWEGWWFVSFVVRSFTFRQTDAGSFRRHSKQQLWITAPAEIPQADEMQAVSDRVCGGDHGPPGNGTE